MKIFKALLTLLIKIFSKERRAEIYTQSEFDFWKNKIQSFGGEWVEGRTLWLVGLRNLDEFNRFNDILILLYWQNGEAQIYKCKGTTDPGVKGSNFVACGVYSGLWERGNRASFAKLYGVKKFIVGRQRVPVRILPDKNRDGLPDDTRPRESMGQFQFHPMSKGDKQKSIGNWSQGCIGPALFSDWLIFDDLWIKHNRIQQHDKYRRLSFALFTAEKELKK